ncbi:peptidase A24A prepilin type IV [Rhodomicrobium vannielii ATCC 17100]|uniref:Peptidase A24A prepilin type IV n=1 Tax=Rhodomicrobium vannielii (strain ATCC 17100 / DSM 162 / LMG 4299 / NCIMB 10020 / ATH 3.1.1) TaxID=648757 RepID=E3HZL5_RHOVT|nr:prepilin peptidase [Rhodomicrobium vannielii]ADP71050.1 peptidase A24A prepilin type IV [Rhodomicrobium vannielii ATCC 17100]
MLISLVFGLVFLSCVVVIARDDWAFGIVPDYPLLALGAAGAAFAFCDPEASYTSALETFEQLAARAAILGFFGYSVAVLFRLIRGRDGLGLGDVKLMAAAGVWSPTLSGFYAITSASVAALVLALGAQAWRGQSPALTEALPFALFLGPTFFAFWVFERMNLLSP